MKDLGKGELITNYELRMKKSRFGNESTFYHNSKFSTLTI